MERVLGARDAHGDGQLRRLEQDSHTLIQLEAWATSDGYTRVSMVGPAGARRWLLELVRSLGSGEPGARTRGLTILRHVRSSPLHPGDLTAAGWAPPLHTHLALPIVLRVPCSLWLPNLFPHLWISRSAFWGSLRL